MIWSCSRKNKIKLKYCLLWQLTRLSCHLLWCSERSRLALQRSVVRKQHSVIGLCVCGGASFSQTEDRQESWERKDLNNKLKCFSYILWPSPRHIPPWFQTDSSDKSIFPTVSNQTSGIQIYIHKYLCSVWRLFNIWIMPNTSFSFSFSSQLSLYRNVSDAMTRSDSFRYVIFPS